MSQRNLVGYVTQTFTIFIYSDEIQRGGLQNRAWRHHVQVGPWLALEIIVPSIYINWISFMMLYL